MEQTYDNIKDVFSSIKERLSNPFIISFVISWLLWNWKVTTGMLFYSASNLEILGVSSYWELVTSNTDLVSNLVAPLLSAVVYTFLFPLAKLGINSFNAWVDRNDQNNVLKISQKGSIPTVKYLELQKTYDGYIKELSDIVRNEGQIKKENIDLKANKLTLESNIGELKDTDKKLKALTNISSLSGHWLVSINDSYHNEDSKQAAILKPGDYKWIIEDRIVEMQTLKLEKYSEDYMIYRYICNPYDRNVHLEIREISNQNQRGNGAIEQLPLLRWNEDYTAIYGSGIKFSLQK